MNGLNAISLIDISLIFVVIGYIIRIERRITRVETKIEVVLNHLGREGKDGE